MRQLHTLIALAVLASPALSQSLLVSDGGGDKVVRFEYPWGAPLDHFVGRGVSLLDGANGMTIGPDGNLYIASAANNRVLRFDGRTGKPLGEFVPAGSGGLNVPDWITFGPDGNLYVTSVNNHRVIRYNGLTGEPIDTFVAPGSGSLRYPRGLAFSPANGDLYVSSTGNAKILRFDGQTGAFVSEALYEGEAGLDRPHDLVFDDAGTLYIASYGSNLILALPENGQARVLVAGSDGLDGPVGLALDLDRNALIAASWNGDGNVLEFDKDTGAFLGVLLDPLAGGLSGTLRDLTLLPDPCEADFDRDGLVDTRDFIAFLNAWTAGCP